MPRFLFLAILVSCVALPAWSEGSATGDPLSHAERQSIITDEELHSLPPDVADRVLDMLQHGRRFETGIRAVVQHWTEQGDYAGCGGPVETPEQYLGV